ncbi:MAG: hypothetical protein JXN60_07420 [Lentisphaerae bacterium]|nr:hypothetical protein [Lentisphaerota bacterium]
MNKRNIMILLWIAAIGASVLLYAANLFLGDLNQDEGWYLYAARLVSEGKLPYIDFANTQGPLMPIVYAVAHPLVNALGLAGGRLFTALQGFAAAAAVAWLAFRLTKPGQRHNAALTAFSLVALNVYQSYFCTIVKTYALTGLLMTLGFVALSFMKARRQILPAFLSGVLMGMAAAVRTSAGAAIPVVLTVLTFQAVKNKKEAQANAFSVTSVICFGIGAAVSLTVLFAPFLVKAREALWFGLVEYHTGRDVGGLIKQCVFKAGFISRSVYAYFVAVALGIVVATIRITRSSVFREDDQTVETINRRGITAALWWSALVVTIVHLAAPFPYDDYQTIVFPLYVAAISVAAVKYLNLASCGPVAAIVVLCLISSFSSPMNQAWFIGERDRIWWPLKEETPLRKLQKTAGLLSDITKPGDLLLTQDLYLAVETGLTLPAGLELGPFSYFPEWSREKAEKCHVLNRDMMLDLLNASSAPVAAFSGYGLAIRSPAITELSKPEQAELMSTLTKRYMLFREIESFGQANTLLRIYLLKR